MPRDASPIAGNIPHGPATRRHFLQQMGTGFGGLALAAAARFAPGLTVRAIGDTFAMSGADVHAHAALTGSDPAAEAVLHAIIEKAPQLLSFGQK
jgi:hypothetical protein